MHGFAERLPGRGQGWRAFRGEVGERPLLGNPLLKETQQPGRQAHQMFVFVEPGAFMAMFFGVGILKVKGLYRKLRKLATRYGGVIVFFDEADSLGNRGGMAQGGWNVDPTPGSAWSTALACNGLGYVSEPGRRNVVFGAVPDGTGPHKEHMIMPGYGGVRSIPFRSISMRITRAL